VANTIPTGRAVSHPLPSYLRIPLSWYSSTTHSYFPDESAHTIRRVYTSPDDPSSLRHFCGFCGTPLSYWSENPPDESDFISLTLGALEEEDLRDLEELGVIPGDAEGESETADRVEQAAQGDLGPGVPWFESMVSGSRLETIKRSAGTRRDGNWSIEWEIVEWIEGETPGAPSTLEAESESADRAAGKRKLDDPAESDTTKKGWDELRG
jgi:hypothetical protein